MADEVLNQPTAASATTPIVQPYDFRAKGSASSLDELHAAFAAELSTALSQHLRGGGVDVTFRFAEQIRYDEFLYSLGETSCLGVLRVDPPGAEALLDLSLPVVYAMIDRLLGGQPDAPAVVPQRPLTQIEQGFALQIVERAAGRLTQTWARVAPSITVREQSLESSPTDVRLMPGDETVWAARFEVRMSGSAGVGGTMSLCIPTPVTEFLRDVPAYPISYAQRDAAKQSIQSHLLDAAVELRALLAQTKLRLSDVLDMAVGDVITTETSADADVDVQVEGTEKLHGRLGQLRGTRAVHIVRDDGTPDQAPNSERPPGSPEGGS